MKKVIYLLFFICFLACEVQDEVDSNGNIWVYTKIISTNADCVNCEVKVVGSDGNAVSGAIVNVVNPANKMVTLKYNNGEYKGFFESLISGEYSFFIKTVNDGKSQTIEKKVVHTVITGKPKVVAISDEMGNSALNGKNLDCTKKINVDWEKTNGTIYIVTVQKDDSIIYSANTSDNYLIIPENTLEIDTNYSISITAQYLEGDPFLYSVDYASQSSYDGTSIYFRTGSNNEET